MQKFRRFFLKLAVVAILIAPSFSLLGVHFNTQTIAENAVHTVI
jgi:hypothetical protein